MSETSNGQRPRRIVTALLATAMIAGLAVLLPASPAAAACASPTKTLQGSLDGEDERYISGAIGIVLYDSQKRHIGLDGCLLGSAQYIGFGKVNDNPNNSCCYLLDADGVPASQGSGLEKSWRVTGLPSNTAYVTLEAYLKQKTDEQHPDSTVWGDSARYGGAWRYQMPYRSSAITMELPLACGKSEAGVTGNNGVVTGIAYNNGRPAATPNRVLAWSILPESDNYIKGFASGYGLSGGRFRIPNLEPGVYTLRISGPDGGTQVYDVEVDGCGETLHHVAYRGGIPKGTDTPGVVRGTSVLMRNSNSGGAADKQFNFGAPGDKYIAGDWNGDGIDTIGVLRGNRFLLRNANSSGSPDIDVAYGKPGDIPVVGDWDGNGTETIGVRRGATFYLRNKFAGGPADITLAYGKPSDTAVVGDWNGDGKDTFGVRRGNEFYLRNKNTSGVADIVLSYGKSTDQPVVGDFDGDGDDTFGVRRGGSYYLRNTNTTGNAHLTFSFGQPGDKPIYGDWNGG